MSRNRCGRNQKRHHREEIARLNFELDIRRCQVETLDNALTDQKAVLREVVEAINEVVQYSALLPPNKLGAEDFGDQPRRLRLVSCVRRSVCGATGVFEPTTLDVPIIEVDMYEVRATLESRVDIFQRFVHILLPSPERDYVYRISENTWRHMKMGGKLPEIARMIYGQIMTALQAETVKC